MAEKKDDLQIDNLKLPNIGIKITRKGDAIKFSVKGYELELKQIPDAPNQTYPLLLLDKFISEVTTVVLQKEIDDRENKAAALQSLKDLGITGDAATREADAVVRQIANMDLGGQ
jgi:hypothetical protein